VLRETSKKADTLSLRTLEYSIAESLTGIGRNSLMSMASITTVGLSLAILGGFVLIALGLNSIVHSQMDQFEISVWLKTNVPDKQVQEMDRSIRALPHVRSVNLETAETTWEKIKASWEDTIELGGVEPSVLTDHFRVKLDDPKFTQITAAGLRGMSGVDEVVEGQAVVEHMLRFADLVKWVGIAAAGALFLVAGFIVNNTIRLTLYARRREIKIMQLVGATNWFIRLPFVFEGTILGAIGAAIACLVIFGGAKYAGQLVSQMMPLLRQFSSGVDPLQFFGGLVILGCFIGMMSSLVSIRQFLRAN
jgi:cell division transport system permease protein